MLKNNCTIDSKQLNANTKLKLINYSEISGVYKFYCQIVGAPANGSHGSFKANGYVTIDINKAELRLKSFNLYNSKEQKEIPVQLFQMNFINGNDVLITFPPLNEYNYLAGETRLAGGHLYSTTSDLHEEAPYRNINIINNMKPLQFDIKDETEETQSITQQ